MLVAAVKTDIYWLVDRGQFSQNIEKDSVALRVYLCETPHFYPQVKDTSVNFWF